MLFLVDLQKKEFSSATFCLKALLWLLSTICQAVITITLGRLIENSFMFAKCWKIESLFLVLNYFEPFSIVMSNASVRNPWYCNVHKSILYCGPFSSSPVKQTTNCLMHVSLNFSLTRKELASDFVFCMTLHENSFLKSILCRTFRVEAFFSNSFQILRFKSYIKK